MNQVNYDGKNNYSEVKLVQFGIQKMGVYPNYVRAILKFTTLINNGQIEIFNAMGQSVRTLELKGDEINLENLEDGVYILRVEDGSGSLMLNQKFIKLSK